MQERGISFILIHEISTGSYLTPIVNIENPILATIIPLQMLRSTDIDLSREEDEILRGRSVRVPLADPSSRLLTHHTVVLSSDIFRIDVDAIRSPTCQEINARPYNI